MNGIKYFTLRLSFLLILFLAFCPACKDDFNSSIPYARVNLNISITNNNGLTVPANPVYFSGGFAGIIVIYTGFSYAAYDAACPYNVDFNCRFEDDGDVIATCPCCGSQYNLLSDGDVIKGPSAERLKQYEVNQSGDRLYITN
jgi:nitrite reductase/ring-hydroxylating ferredoxin subunit